MLSHSTSVSYYFNLSEVPLNYSDGSCSFNSSSNPRIRSILHFYSGLNDGDFGSLGVFTPNQLPSDFLSSTSSVNCRHFASFGTPPQPSFNSSSLDSAIGSAILDPSLDNGLTESVFVKSYIKSLVPKYWTSSSGFYTHDSVNVGGVFYDHSFSFDDMFTPGVR